MLDLYIQSLVLMHCPLYVEERRVLFLELGNMGNENISLRTLLGDDGVSQKERAREIKLVYILQIANLYRRIKASKGETVSAASSGRQQMVACLPGKKGRRRRRKEGRTPCL